MHIFSNANIAKGGLNLEQRFPEGGKDRERRDGGWLIMGTNGHILDGVCVEGSTKHRARCSPAQLDDCCSHIERVG